jgi:hypothetical protein
MGAMQSGGGKPAEPKVSQSNDKGENDAVE